MKDNQILNDIRKHTKEKLTEEYSGHDWYHILRVINLSEKIAEKENANKLHVYLIALMHDLFDEKIFKIENKKEEFERFFIEYKLNEILSNEELDSICTDLLHLSFRGKFDNTKLSKEGKIVQDADRLDAVGAIGIARVFAYGGNKNKPIYIPTEVSKESGKDQISHFYVKLLNIKDNLNTKTAKELAEKRHHFLEEFLSNFYEEWDDVIDV